jgi:hypothetical protein
MAIAAKKQIEAINQRPGRKKPRVQSRGKRNRENDIRRAEGVNLHRNHLYLGLMRNHCSNLPKYHQFPM